jgi:hypothetical protein
MCLLDVLFVPPFHAEWPLLDEPGTYTVSYSCRSESDQVAGLSAAPAQRLVVVLDTVCPVCTAHAGPGSSRTSSTVEASFPYTDPGAVCTDNIDGVLLGVQTVGEVDVERAGVYKVCAIYTRVVQYALPIELCTRSSDHNCTRSSLLAPYTSSSSSSSSSHQITYRAHDASGNWNDGVVIPLPINRQRSTACTNASYTVSACIIPAVSACSIPASH